MAAAGPGPRPLPRDPPQEGAPGRDHGRARRGGRAVHPLAGRRAGLQGLPRLPGLDLRLAELDGRARHPGLLPSSSAATSSRSTSAWCSTAGWPTPRSRTRSATSRRSPSGCSPPPRRRCSTPSSSAVPGNRLGDVSHAVQARVEADGFSVIRSLVGHGIGRDMHEDPQIPNFGDPGTGPELEEGMVLAIEPMVNVGQPPRAHGLGQLGGLLPGRLAGRPLRAHRGHYGGRPAHPHALAPEEARRRTGCSRCYSFRSALSRLLGSRADPRLSIRSRFTELDEGPSISQAHVREVQDHPPRRRGPRDLPEPPSQAASGVTTG